MLTAPTDMPDPTLTPPLTIARYQSLPLTIQPTAGDPDAGEFNSRQYLAIRTLAPELERSYPVIGETLMLTGASPAL
jgi:hypothetical protein